MPDSFRRSGGQRGIDIALAYNPPTRARRLDYLASRMEFFLVRGIPLDEIVATFARLDPEDDADIESLAPDRNGKRDDKDSESLAASPPTVSELGSKVCALAPSNPIRSKGANQLGRRVFSTRFDPSSHEPMHLVVRNTNRWDDDGATQPYALACAMWRSETQPELHAELEARLEAVVELPVQIELEV